MWPLECWELPWSSWTLRVVYSSLDLPPACCYCGGDKPNWLEHTLYFLSVVCGSHGLSPHYCSCLWPPHQPIVLSCGLLNNPIHTSIIVLSCNHCSRQCCTPLPWEAHNSARGLVDCTMRTRMLCVLFCNLLFEAALFEPTSTSATPFLSEQLCSAVMTMHMYICAV